MAARIVPFGCYALFLLISQAVGWLEQASGWSPSLVEAVRLWLYPVKIVLVAATLVGYWRHYTEIPWPPKLSAQTLLLTTAIGILVYIAWVRMDWAWAIQGPRSSGYNPFASQDSTGYLLAAFRIFGAACVVPVMEELFWRSFLLRYMMSSRFDTVPLGTVTPLSFVVVVILFGLEHDLWLAGMMAGAAYGFLLVQTKNLWTCIGAHAITNLALGIHVLVTGEWYWW